MSIQTENVAAVCGNELRIYGPVEGKKDTRPLRSVTVYAHHGAAKAAAQEYDDARKPETNRR